MSIKIQKYNYWYFLFISFYLLASNLPLCDPGATALPAAFLLCHLSPCQIRAEEAEGKTRGSKGDLLLPVSLPARGSNSFFHPGSLFSILAEPASFVSHRYRRQLAAAPLVYLPSIPESQLHRSLFWAPGLPARAGQL